MARTSKEGRIVDQFGDWCEKRVVNDLIRHGWNALQHGQHGTVVDVMAYKGRHKWYVQVKGSQDTQPSWPSPGEIGRLKSVATRNNGRAIVALVMHKTKPSINYYYAGSGRSANPDIGTNT